MLIDCDTCVARDIACNQCVIAVLLGPDDRAVDLDAAEQAAVDTLAGAGLVPPLRLVPAVRFTPAPAPRASTSGGAIARGA